MNEAHRQFVMGVAGVRLWYAREALPGAAPSPEFDFGEPEAEAPDSEEVAIAPVSEPSRPRPEASRQGLARLQGLLAGKAPAVASPPPADNESGVAVAQASAQGEPASTTTRDVTTAAEPDETEVARAGDVLAGQAVQFYWRFWVGEHWLLVSRCPDAAGRGLEDRLAANILRALNDHVVREDTLRWPVFNNPAVPGNDAAGALEIITALAGSVDRPRKLLLGLESDAPDSDNASLWQQIVSPLGEPSVAFPVSLASLSSDPAAKRALWQALQQAGRR